MCGILGVWGPQLPEPERIQRALQALQSRGPDGSGLWWEPQGRGLLAHTRLAIRDRAGGAQPLHAPERGLSLVINGELYDRGELRERLSRWGYCFRTRSDSELALALYACEGEAFVEQLRGEFALLLWDASRQCLLAVRDRFGIKPLYYALDPQRQTLMLASRQSALRALGVSLSWDRVNLAQISCLQYPLPGHSLFAEIAQLPPGHLLRWQAGTLHVQAWWQPDYPARQALVPEDSTTLLPELQALLQEAVRLRLDAEVPVGSYLSAGLDSSLVTALMGPTPVPAFCAGFPGWPGNEGPQAEETAAALGRSCVVVNLAPNTLSEALADTVIATEGLAINAHVTARRLLCREIRARGVRVMLTGEGADELFGGYVHLLEELWPGRPGTHSLQGMHLPLGDRLELPLLTSALGGLPLFLQAKASLGLRLRSLLSPDFCAAYPVSRVEEQLLALLPLENLRAAHPLHRSLQLWIRLALAGYILPTVGDGAEMAEGIEGRLPFLDPPLFDRVRTLPPEQLIQPGHEKALLRARAHAFLPAAVCQRTKAPFLAPPLLTQGLQAAPAQWQAWAEALFPAPLPDFVERDALWRCLQALAHLPAAAHQLWEPPLMLLHGICTLHRAWGVANHG